MASTTNKRTNRKTSSGTSRKTTSASTTSAHTNKAEAVEQNTEYKSEPKVEPKKVSPKDVDVSQYITVYNGFQGKLIYKSRKTGETYEWDNFGDEQEMELIELKNAKNSAKSFFINNWFMFDEDNKWVIDYLGLSQYYKNAIDLDKFDDVFKMSPEEIGKTVSALSDGQKRSLMYRAKQLVSQNKIDSISVIHELEKALGVELVEK